MRARVLVLAGDRPGRSVTFSGSLTIGRAPESELEILDTGASRQHARLVRDAEESEWVLLDLRAPSGTSRPREARGHRIEFGQQFQIGNTVLLFTHANELEARLREDEKLAAVERFAARAMHDLNSVLGPIQLSLGFLREAWDKGELSDNDFEACVRDIDLATAQAADLGRSLVGARRVPTRPMGATDLREVAEEVTRQLEPELSPSILVRLSGHEKAVVWGDRTQLRLLLLNICHNARDAMPRGGRIRIALAFDGSVPPRRPDIEAPHICLRVEDNGEGMDRDTVARLFEPFFSTRGRSGAKGLGLADAYEIVKRHRGDIEVASMRGDGTRVTIRLPAFRGHVPVEPDAPSLVRILIGRRGPGDAFRRRLERLGHTVIRVADANAAMGELAKRNFDYLVLDHEDLSAGNEEVLQELRRGWPTTSVIVSGKNVSATDRSRLLSLGAKAVLPSQFDTMTLKTVLLQLERARKGAMDTGRHQVPREDDLEPRDG